MYRTQLFSETFFVYIELLQMEGTQFVGFLFISKCLSQVMTKKSLTTSINDKNYCVYI